MPNERTHIDEITAVFCERECQSLIVKSNAEFKVVHRNIIVYMGWIIIFNSFNLLVRH